MKFKKEDLQIHIFLLQLNLIFHMANVFLIAPEVIGLKKEMLRHLMARKKGC